MKTIKLVALASLFVSQMAAALPCDGFEIKLKNDLADDLLVTKIKLHGGKLSPGGIQKLDSKTEQVFTVNNTSSLPMAGELVFHTITLPSKTVKIHFNLANTDLGCSYADTSPTSDYSVAASGSLNQLNYTIYNR
ncbi:hypothetical protein [Legionella gresilensis]|uniref:hypothetical protein n=1 Tax=Legionella gresilensis TaxID=91823 RepID=UPI0010414DB9|nr:hypothetical protein [Legionella gresilensis]